MTIIRQYLPYPQDRAIDMIFAGGTDFDGSGLRPVADIKGNAVSARDAKRLRKELAELREMLRLGAGIPGDKQRIRIIESLLAPRSEITDPS